MDLRSFPRRAVFWILAAASWALAPGCPKPPPLPPPPVGAGGPATQSLAERDRAIDAVRARAVIRTRVPEGRPGAPGGKLSAIVLAAARPPRARLEVLTPLGTPAATVLLADGLFQVYDPFAHRLTRAPLDSPEIAAQLGALPIPLERLPTLLRGVVPLEPGEVTEVPVKSDAGTSGEGGAPHGDGGEAAGEAGTPDGDGGEVAGEAGEAADEGGAASEAATEGGGDDAESGSPGAAEAAEAGSDASGGATMAEADEILVEVRQEGRLVQRVRMHRAGGYPLEEVRFDPQTALPVSRIVFSSYGGAPSPEGPVAFPQKITARLYEPAVAGSVESASVELRLSRIEVDPSLPEDSFRLEFDRPPEVREL